MPFWRVMKLMSLLTPGAAELFHQGDAHFLDAHAHAGEFLFPQRAQRRRRQHQGDDLRAVRRRVGVVGADHALELAQHAVGFLFRRAHDAERADALAVEREALREAGGDEEVEAGVHEHADHRAVFGDAVAEALVGHVEEGHQVARLDGRDDLRPLRRRDVVAGRVVAAGVQHDDACPGSRRSAPPACRRSRRRGGRVVVRIGADREAGALEQRAVVFPARVADQHLGASGSGASGSRRRPSGRRCRPGPAPWRCGRP